MKDRDYVSTNQLTHLIECQQQRPSLGESQQHYNSRLDDTSETQQQQQSTTMAAVATVASCLDATTTASGGGGGLDYQHLHHQHHQHQLQLQQYHQQQAYQQQQHQHHQHVNNYHYAGYLNSEHYGDQAAGVTAGSGSPADIHNHQQQQEQKPSTDGAEWLAANAGHLQVREPLAYSPWLASQQHQDSCLQQQVPASQEQYGQQEQLHNAAYAAESQLASTTPATGHVSPAIPVTYNPSAVAALYSSTILQHQQQAGYQHQGHQNLHQHHHQLEHHHQPSTHQHEFGQVQAHQQQLHGQDQNQNQNQNHNQQHQLHQHHHKAAWLHTSSLPLASVSSPPELQEGLEANQQQQQPLDEDGHQRHSAHNLCSVLPGPGQVSLLHHHHHHHHSPSSSASSSSSSSSSSSLMNLSPSSGDNSRPTATATTTTTVPPVGSVTSTKKAPAKGSKRPTLVAGKKKLAGMAKATNGRSNHNQNQNLSRNPQAAVRVCPQSATNELHSTSYTSHHLLGAIHVAGPYKDADIEHNETHIVVTNVETGRKVTLTNEQLTSLSVRQLNKMVAGFPRQTITKLKQRRRTLKNRGYAQNCRHKRVSQTKKLERQNQELSEENRELRNENQELNLMIRQLRRQLQAADTITMTSGEHHHQETPGAGQPRRPQAPAAYPIECKQYSDLANGNGSLAPAVKGHSMLPFIGKVRDLELQVSHLQDQLR